MTLAPPSRRAPTLSVGRIERHLRDGQRRSLVEIVDCELRGGTCYALVGESGIGKTTALEMLALARAPDRMERFAFERGGRAIDLAGLLRRGDRQALAQVRARHFGYVTQASLLLPFLTVRQNIELAQDIAARHDRRLVDMLIDGLELSPLQRAMPNALSGGQRQRACIARALAHHPDVVLADEPTSAVDAEMGRLIVGMILAHARETGAVALIITHNVAMVREFGLPELAVDSASTAEGLHTTISAPRAAAQDVAKPALLPAGAVP